MLGVCDELNRHATSMVYPNRIHALLSRDADRSINDGTLRDLQTAAAAITDRQPDTARLSEAMESAAKVWPLVAASDEVPRAVAERLGLPVAVAEDLITRCGFTLLPPVTHPMTSTTDVAAPDWSFQADAERICLRELKVPNTKIGLIVPTGGGKTRIALRIALGWLANHSDGLVLWITHQKNLREQARRELQQMLLRGDHGLPPDAAKLLAEQIEIVMVQKDLRDRLLAHDGTPILAIVDEGHHAAAPGYKPIFETSFPLPALFLTATPNRTDELPLGIHQIAYSITYRELANRGVIVLPHFEEFRVADFNWSPEAIGALADEIVERTANEFTKTLVLAPRVERVVEFYEALRDRIAARDDHPLTVDDVGYIHGGGNSHDLAAEHFLGAFREKPRAIYVSAQLLLEGFDDPSVNAVVITYQSKSLVKLMQAAGRCVRYAPEKTASYVVQARSEALEYYFDQRWLYQEISDRFRPELLDYPYASAEQLRETMTSVLATHNVAQSVREDILNRLADVTPGQTCRLLFTGLPYFGARLDFTQNAKWSAFLETEKNSQEFRWIFNDFSGRGTDAADPIEFLRYYGKQFSFAPAYDMTAPWRRYSDILTAIHNAAQELTGAGAQSADGISRPYTENGATTWLRYVTFRYDPVIAPDFAQFLADCYNATTIVGTYTKEPSGFGACLKLLLPGGGYEAHLLRTGDDHLLRAQIAHVRAEILSAPPIDRFAKFAASITQLPGLGSVPGYVINRLDQLVNDEPNLFFSLKGTPDDRPEKTHLREVR